MKWIGWLFEQPAWLYVALAVAEGVIGFGWLLSRRRRWARAAVVPPAVAVVVILLGIFVQTNRERIASALKDIAAKAQKGDFAPAGGYLDPACQCPVPGGGSVGRDGLISRGQWAIKTFSVRMVRAQQIRTTIDGDSADTELAVWTTSDAGFRSLTWQVKWVRRREGWRIVEVKLIKPEDIRELLF